HFRCYRPRSARISSLESYSYALRHIVVYGVGMGARTFIESWPIVRQLSGKDRLGRGQAAMSARSENMQARTVDADRVVDSVCPYCAVGCGQKILVKAEKIIQIE